MCRGTDAGGGAELCNMWSLICNASEYAEELWRCIRDASEKCRVQYTGLYSDNLLRSGSHAKGYHLDTLYNLFDIPSLVITGNCLSS